VCPAVGRPFDGRVRALVEGAPERSAPSDPTGCKPLEHLPLTSKPVRVCPEARGDDSARRALGTLRRCKRREADAFKRRVTDLRWVHLVLRYCRLERGVAREQEKSSTRGRREPKCIEVFARGNAVQREIRRRRTREAFRRP